MPKKNAADFSAKVDELLPKHKEQAAKDLQGALDNLFILEKQTRQGSDFNSTTRVANCIIQLCFEHKEFDQLNSSLTIISKRRGQEKKVIQAVVQEAMTYLEKIDDLKIKFALIETLRTITDGKIFVEIERAALYKKLAAIKEEQGEVKEAASILQEVQVETLGKMEKADKIDYILLQVRLCLDAQDFIRAVILSRKINPKLLLTEDMQELKLKYYHLMIRYHSNEEDFLEICRAYQNIYNTACVKKDATLRMKYLQLVSFYTILSPSGPEQRDILLKTFAEKHLNAIPKFKALLKLFLTEELMPFPQMEEGYKALFSSLSLLSPSLWVHFRLRVVEHNIRVIGKYYTRIRSSRLAQLLDLSEEETELRLSEMVVEGNVYAKIDRPAGIISFVEPQNASEVLNDWSSNITQLLDLIAKTCHLIHREKMVHAATAAK